MKLIIAGGRDLTDISYILAGIELMVSEITEVVSGKNEGTKDPLGFMVTPGADALGEEWADSKGIPVMPFYPDWRAYGKAAGPIRNKAMAVYADMLLAVWDGKSKGTHNMIFTMIDFQKPIIIIPYKS